MSLRVQRSRSEHIWHPFSAIGLRRRGALRRCWFGALKLEAEALLKLFACTSTIQQLTWCCSLDCRRAFSSMSGVSLPKILGEAWTTLPHFHSGLRTARRDGKAGSRVSASAVSCPSMSRTPHTLCLTKSSCESTYGPTVWFSRASNADKVAKCIRRLRMFVPPIS